MSHSICLRACKICVVIVEMKPESNFRKLRKVLSPPQMLISSLFLLSEFQLLSYFQFSQNVFNFNIP